MLIKLQHASVVAELLMDDSAPLTVRGHPSLGQSRGFWERPGLFGGGDDLLRAAGSALRPDHERIRPGLFLRHRALARPAAEPERWLLLHTGRTEHTHTHTEEEFKPLTPPDCQNRGG